MTVATESLLVFAVLVAWVTALAFLRVHSNYDRLHAITFFNLLAGGAITAAVVIRDGLSARTFQAVLVWLVVVAGGALLSHAIARALHAHGEEP